MRAAPQRHTDSTPSTKKASETLQVSGDNALAHIAPDGQLHMLADHLDAVGKLAAQFASTFYSSDWARLAGEWHDIGKYAADFQAMIRSANGMDAHIEAEESSEKAIQAQKTKTRVDHSSAGAVLARQVFGADLCGLALSFCIAGHHAGLADHRSGMGRPLEQRLRETVVRLDAAKEGGFRPTNPAKPEHPAHLVSAPQNEFMRAVELWIRMLFSTLVDADFLDTESFFDAARKKERQPSASIDTLAQQLDNHLRQITGSSAPSQVNQMRALVLGQCRAAASLQRGVFSLTVTTGGGKTLSSLAFALHHARHHGLGRVIVAIPFTSIIEQTAAVFRKALGDEAVVEHHCNVDPQHETARNRLACENWDAPIVVTTNVQLLESLFANRPSRCRKLHRLARSVIVLDEAQNLPTEFLDPSLQVLRSLTRDYGCSLLLCTATQPALRQRRHLPGGFANIREIVADPGELATRLRRTRIEWPSNTDEAPAGWQALAQQIAAHPAVLAIVDRRKDARALTEALDTHLGDTSTIHLSALMCAAHRSSVLKQVKSRLAAGQAVRLVSTQLVEAGVDIDFPVVYRSLAGLDAITQAAGGCNREGKLRGEAGPTHGLVRVFRSPAPPPAGFLRKGYEVTCSLLNECSPSGDAGLDLFLPSTIDTYFRRLLSLCDRDAKGIEAKRELFQFRSVARDYKLIANGQLGIFVAYDASAQRLAEQLRAAPPSRALLRRSQRYLVSITERDALEWQKRGCVELLWEQLHILRPQFTHHYCARFGLAPAANETYQPDDLMV